MLIPSAPGADVCNTLERIGSPQGLLVSICYLVAETFQKRFQTPMVSALNSRTFSWIPRTDKQISKKIAC